MIHGVADATGHSQYGADVQRRESYYHPLPPVDVPRITDPADTPQSSTPPTNGLSSYMPHLQGSWPTPATSSYTFTSPPPPSTNKLYEHYDTRASRSPVYDTATSTPQQQSTPASTTASSSPQHPLVSATTAANSYRGLSSGPSGLPGAPQPPILASNGGSSTGVSMMDTTYKTHHHSPAQSYYTTTAAPSQHHQHQQPQHQHHQTQHHQSASFATPYQPTRVSPQYTMPYSGMHHSLGRPNVLSGLNNGMAMMPNIPMGYLPMSYMSHGPPQQERPYKCDQCPQSFNRNHDLKRHKRIHLSVKPFPCTFCDKSFSRKDALKRHRLVKGCGDRACPKGGVMKKPGTCMPAIPEQTQSS